MVKPMGENYGKASISMDISMAISMGKSSFPYGSRANILLNNRIS